MKATRKAAVPTVAPRTAALSSALLAAAQPDLYRANAFRVTGLPVTATAREIARHGERLRMMEKLGGSPQLSRLLPLDPAPDADALREAQQRMLDPERRLIDELFWFWPRAGGGPDEALAALSRGDVDAAVKAWETLESGDAQALGRHNLVVLWHAVALDAEAETSDPMAPSQRQRRDAYWPLALAGWARIAEQEPVWDRLKARVLELDDPRLTAQTVDGLRATLPVAVLSIVGELATRAGEAGQPDEARRFVALLSGSGFSVDAVHDAQARAATPLRNRISVLCNSAVPDAEADPEHADRVAEQLATQTGSLLEALDRFLRGGHPTRDAVHDEVALRLLACQVVYGNKTNDWRRSLELLRPALAVAASASAKARIRENIKILEQNLIAGQCFFCSASPPYVAADIEVAMYREVSRTRTFRGTRVDFKTLTARVPRCSSCKRAHGRSAAGAKLGAVVGLLVGVGACAVVAASSGVEGCVPLLGCAAVTGVGAGIGKLIGNAGLKSGVKPASAVVNFAGVKKLLAEGWTLGAGPAS